MSSEPHSKRGIHTRLAHSGHNPRDFHGFVNPPVVHASTVLFPDYDSYATRNQKYIYGTHGTPTTDALADALNELEGAAGTVLAPSGLAAITVPLLGFVSAGDHILIVDSVYFPTRQFADTMLRRLGVEVEYYDPLIGADIETLIKPNTSVIFTESPGSSTFEIQDIPAIAEAAHRHGAIVMMDNTWATPLYFRALDHGVDVVIHAATKYMSGHSDVLFGTMSANEAAWPRLLDAFHTLGACPSPDDTYQVLRGLRTLGVRLAHQEKAGLSIARWLDKQPGVSRVLHPALESFPGHALWKRDFTGASGLFAVVLDGGGTDKARAFLNALEIFGLGSSWGGYESLAQKTNLDARTVAKGPYEGAVLRLQIGLEDVEDLKADLTKGLEAAAKV